ncbi:MAG: CRISPR-associated protein Csx3 [Armatimonadetes bacterium]|nr:MAG: CRISPR-associated protein Csx3 [Armatimonadota bacterium]
MGETGEIHFEYDRAETSVGPALHVRIAIEGGITTPEQYARAVERLVLPQEEAGLGVVFDGPSPIWGYAMLCHIAHPFAWVATWDPRIAGAVVVQSHWPGVSAGQIIQLNKEEEG